MGIQYAGVDLLLEDPQGEICAWLERHLPLAETAFYGERPIGLTTGNRMASRSGQRAARGLPLPNYPPAPPPRLNCLYWPTGATRWSTFYGLVDTAGKDQLLETLDGAITGPNEPHSLILDDGTETISTEMYLLPPRKLTSFAEGETNSPAALWLIPLVDKRYYWQFRSMGNTTVDATNDDRTATDWEIQTVDVAAQENTYQLRFTDADGEEHLTSVLTVTATAAEMQTALRAIPGLELVTVALAGTTYTITFVGARHVPQLTNTLTGFAEYILFQSFNAQSTWDDLIEAISERLDVEEIIVDPGAETTDPDDDDPIPDEYHFPDPAELTRQYDNAAVLLDAVAHSVGRRIVRDRDGDVRMLSWDQSETRLVENEDGTQGELSWQAGDDFSDTFALGVIPEKVQVIFPKYRWHHAFFGGEVHIEEVDSTDAGADSSLGFTEGLVKVIHTTAYADFANDSENVLYPIMDGQEPFNADDLAELALQIATDYYASLKKRWDRRLAGLFRWQPTGWDDHALWFIGARRDGEYDCGTRIQTLPYNFGVEEMLHQFEGKEVFGDLIAGVVDDDGVVGNVLGQGGTTMLSVYTYTFFRLPAIVGSDTGNDVRVVNIHDSDGIDPPKLITARWNDTGNFWQYDGSAC